MRMIDCDYDRKTEMLFHFFKHCLYEEMEFLPS